jgi:hypothetical protein
MIARRLLTRGTRIFGSLAAYLSLPTGKVCCAVVHLNAGGSKLFNSSACLAQSRDRCVPPWADVPRPQIISVHHVHRRTTARRCNYHTQVA